MSEIVIHNLTSPFVLIFLLGMIATIFKSDLKIPSSISEVLSLFLLIAIGLKGGIALSQYDITMIMAPIGGALLLGFFIPIFVLIITKWTKLDFANSIGLAASFGSVSIVTYGAAISFLEHSAVSYEGFMNALVVLMESPAIIVSIFLYKVMEKNESIQVSSVAFSSPYTRMIDKEIIKESIFGKSVFILLGCLLIGFISADAAAPIVQPLFFDLYNGVLILFLLNMGLLAGERITEVKKHGISLIGLAILFPIVFGSFGVVIGSIVGLSVGGATLMGVLAGSASYIAAPAALKTSVKKANPSIYLGLSLGITFPFNLIIGIPMYFHIAKFLTFGGI
ncbi:MULTISPECIES: sodium-dependent bicarbonate transport family permease [Sutcliffiella]|uniref:Sodium-dependent bicarbonate transport family permease n=1 Tax=Sutcliffiella cohnii TaxID=33932 RepID=A0A223KQM2_9BACI|nr:MULTISPECIES: sodium-dependent bicarbonate transport family permease [Sutcliffiella]AST91623.1 sodium-dependent bicarbonate transport family permease [Sutcliffiella cohnii]MED4014793.1 sodium-dependent bicarbonate transport family permease [Sutcliffiella cohnii]WBL17456.1 sodium-dependent bicarbonate transport family permease [Sutcliffiella sp. NC1]